MSDNIYIVDNTTVDQSAKKYLSEWCDISRQMDICTGYLEIGGLLSIDNQWQKLDKIRIILGNEVTKRTKDVIDAVVKALLNKIKESIDKEHEKNEFLIGVPAILDALKTRKIECRVYDKSKFHAKAYITYFNDEFLSKCPDCVGLGKGYALVGSSNFTKAGLTQNIELNIQVQKNVEELQEWFEKHWENGIDITEAVFKVLELQCKEYSPYDVYLRSMYEYFKNREETISEWEKKTSVIYKGLAQYQRDAYNALIQIADKYSGAFLCDGVGLGKTYVGLMLIERFVKKERKPVVLIVPASARISVWETAIKKYIPEILDGFLPFKIINHTDLLLDKNKNLMQQIADQAEIVVIDEAHHFRNQASNRYRKLMEMMCIGPQKKMFMLTATPINNSFRDLQHLIELFTRGDDAYFKKAPLGIHSLKGHFKKMENRLAEIMDAETSVTDTIDASSDVFHADQLVRQLVVQRSRAYVKKSLQNLQGANVVFSHKTDPNVAQYSLKAYYGDLIDHFVHSFYRKDRKTGRNMPILALAIYSPYESDYYLGDRSKIDDMMSGRQAQVVNLIRQLLLKRFESSLAAFEETCIKIYSRLRKFVLDYKEEGNEKQINRFLAKQEDVIAYVENYIKNEIGVELEDFEDELPDYIWNVDDNFDVSEFDIRAMIDDTLFDMEVLAEFIGDIMDLDPEQDDKIRELKRILTEDPRVKGKKVIIFSEYRSTANYIYKELEKAGFTGLYEIDGQSNVNRHDIVQRFAPYYNYTSSKEIKDEIHILIATDVLAEGLNLQDASCLINYELHWNPVRLMQRIGRVDRRRDVEIEKQLLTDHPELAADRENAYYWNFLPPDDLDQLLELFKTVTKKTLMISKTFGIEGKKLLTPEDDFEALKDMVAQYEGTTSGEEEMALAYQELMKDNPEYSSLVLELPKKMHSGKAANIRGGLFFCYELPTKRADNTWSDGDGLYRWYHINSETNKISEDTYEIWKSIKCDKDEDRIVNVNEIDFIALRKKVESHIKKTYLKSIVAPIGINARLVTWMQLV